ncbi:MAG: hypothetical protein ACRC7W_00415 [Fusobacteriaceae bacterium]
MKNEGIAENVNKFIMEFEELFPTEIIRIVWDSKYGCEIYISNKYLLQEKKSMHKIGLLLYENFYKYGIYDFLFGYDYDTELGLWED